MAESVLSQDQIEARMPLWCALAELFLDTEIQASGYHAIARAAQDGGFSAEQVRDILEQEVFPAFIFNLMVIAGEWAAFHPDDVREQVLGVLGLPGGRPPAPRYWTNGMRTRFLAEEWPKIVAALEEREPDIKPAPPPKREPPILVIGTGLLVVGFGLALVFGWL